MREDGDPYANADECLQDVSGDFKDFCKASGLKPCALVLSMKMLNRENKTTYPVFPGSVKAAHMKLIVVWLAHLASDLGATLGKKQ